MSTHNLRLAMACALTMAPGVAWAQHEAHQSASAPASSVDVAQCLRAQPVVDNIIAAALARAEVARLSNSPTEMRAAVESLTTALRDIRAQSAPCATAATSTEPHAGHPTAPSGEKQMDPSGEKPMDPSPTASDPGRRERRPTHAPRRL